MNKSYGDITLTKEQTAALSLIKNGSVLVGGVGSGKTYTSIFWAIEQRLKGEHIYVITTAKVRDDGAWDESFKNCGLEESEFTIDSWNNIKKYNHIENAIFIFDEQRVVGYGSWSKVFIQIAWHNHWILCSATPGDEWSDYIPVFIANRFYRNKTEFVRKHIIYDPYVTYPKIKDYLLVDILEENRSRICVPMEVNRHTKRHRHYTYCGYDLMLYNQVTRTRFNFIEERPIESPSEYAQLLRRVVSESEDRENKTLSLIQSIDRLIIFYNYNYELDMLLELCKLAGRHTYQWNGKVHDQLPSIEERDQWVYLVQYNAGSEGWNCVTTNHILFYSANYSYKKMEQAEGRIDRMNTPYTDLHYYYMTSNAKIDKDVLKSITRKKRFNEGIWGKKYVKI